MVRSSLPVLCCLVVLATLTGCFGTSPLHSPDDPNLVVENRDPDPFVVTAYALDDPAVRLHLVNGTTRTLDAGNATTRLAVATTRVDPVDGRSLGEFTVRSNQTLERALDYPRDGSVLYTVRKEGSDRFVGFQTYRCRQGSPEVGLVLDDDAISGGTFSC